MRFGQAPQFQFNDTSFSTPTQIDMTPSGITGGHIPAWRGQQSGGYDSSGINPHSMFTGGNQQPNNLFPQRPPNFNPMPMDGMGFGNFNPQPFGKPPQMPSTPYGQGGYDSSGINSGGMFSLQSSMGGGSMRPLFPQFGGMYQGGYGQG